jgi:glycine betaine/proline transport system ATP-binding protein
MSAKLAVESLYKIFGTAAKGAADQLRAGASKEMIMQRSGSVIAVRDVSFSVGEREIFVVMGLSGSGKSTLVRCINRLVEPTGGRVLLDGDDIVKANDEELRRIRLNKIAMVFQHFALFPHKTVRENVEYGLKVRGMPRDARRHKALEALEQVGLRDWADAMPDTLSGGMRQRVGLARALVVDPEVLLMDEPFGALDPLIRRDMQLELAKIQQRFRGAIVFITHDLHEALMLGHRIAIMRAGEFVQVGTAADILTRPADGYVAAFTQDVDRGRFLSVQSIMRNVAALRLSELTRERAELVMREQDCEAIYVTDEENRPLGLLLRRDLQRVDREIAANLRTFLRGSFHCAVRSASLASIYGLCRAELPIAVTDDAGQFCGIVNTRDVWSALADSAVEAGRDETVEAPKVVRSA